MARYDLDLRVGVERVLFSARGGCPSACMHISNPISLLCLFKYHLEQEMDGEAICAAFASSPGPDALRDLIPKLGVRLKVYRAIKSVLDQQYVLQV